MFTSQEYYNRLSFLYKSNLDRNNKLPEEQFIALVDNQVKEAQDEAYSHVGGIIDEFLPALSDAIDLFDYLKDYNHVVLDEEAQIQYDRIRKLITRYDIP